MKRLFFILCLIGYGTPAVSSEVREITGDDIKWIGRKVNGSHHGKVKLDQGRLVFKDNTLTSGEFKIDMKSISVGDIPVESPKNAKLANHLKSEDFFHVEKFRYAGLKIKEVIKKSESEYRIKGDLTIKDKTHPIEFPAQMSNKTLTAKLILNRTRWGIIYGSKSFFKNLADRAIDENFDLIVRLSFEK